MSDVNKEATYLLTLLRVKPKNSDTTRFDH